MEVFMIRGKFKVIDNTPEERFNRVIEILADAVTRAIATEQTGTTNENILHSSTSVFFVNRLPQRGPVPFGQHTTREGVEENPNEKRWIQRIGQLAENGCSTKEIADRLNQEDKKSRRGR